MAERRDLLRALAGLPLAGLPFGQMAGAAPANPKGPIMTTAAAAANTMPTWAEQMTALMPVADRLIARWGRPNVTEAERQDMYTLCLAILSEGYLCHVYMDPRRPVWVPLWNMAYNSGGPNPDYIYGSTQVDPDGVYRISGFRGTNRFIDIQQQANRILPPLDHASGTKSVNDVDDLAHGPDGYFSVILSAKRPEGHTGDWWLLEDNTVQLMLRQCSTDWRNEIDARIAIERLDPVEPATPEETARRFSELPQWIEGMLGFMMELTQWYREHHPTNGLELSKKITKIGGLNNQFYYDGIYRIEDDEALVVETDLPKQCRYWQMLVADDRFCTVDWFNRQSSLNDKTARLDSDGKLRTVISRRDPGVPNWLDKAGNHWGLIQMRFNKASDAPEPKVTRVKLADVRQHLPADTPVVTPEERRRNLAARREAAQFRRTW